jgi:hypothetical protein
MLRARVLPEVGLREPRERFDWDWMWDGAVISISYVEDMEADAVASIQGVAGFGETARALRGIKGSFGSSLFGRIKDFAQGRAVTQRVRSRLP